MYFGVSVDVRMNYTNVIHPLGTIKSAIYVKNTCRNRDDLFSSSFPVHFKSVLYNSLYAYQTIDYS